MKSFMLLLCFSSNDIISVNIVSYIVDGAMTSFSR